MKLLVSFRFRSSHWSLPRGWANFGIGTLAAVALAGCMQTGGSGIFARNAGPLNQNQLVLPTMLRPAPVRTAQPIVAQPIEAPMVPQQVAQPVMMEPEETGYTLDSGDRLRVVVFGQEGLTASYAVDTGGSITMPLIGAVPARGHTPAQLQLAIAAKLRQGFVREPHVAVEVEAYRPFFILGEVTLPGQYPYVANMTVETAVAIAGGYTPRAYKDRIKISRQVSGLTENRVVSPNYPIRPGDTVKIAERWF
ncbi:MAG: polysaccharide biosynthesis/export protein [Hyphomicrobiales bacterium]|nr:polysaccharide biosynthesis/export protein [Hyphomicrobiales bacterium]